MHLFAWLQTGWKTGKEEAFGLLLPCLGYWDTHRCWDLQDTRGNGHTGEHASHFDNCVLAQTQKGLLDLRGGTTGDQESHCTGHGIDSSL